MLPVSQSPFLMGKILINQDLPGGVHYALLTFYLFVSMYFKFPVVMGCSLQMCYAIIHGEIVRGAASSECPDW